MDRKNTGMSVDQPRRNVEFKIALEDWAATCATAERICSTPGTVWQQRDTYFAARSGRLKLREVDGDGAYLVAYHRPDDEGARTSEYHVVPVHDADGVRAALSASVGVTLVVTKTRRVFLWKNVRIHMDRVDGLGEFLEFEAVLGAGETEESGTEQVRELCQRFDLDPSAGIAGSYVDLLRATMP